MTHWVKTQRKETVQWMRSPLRRYPRSKKRKVSDPESESCSGLGSSHAAQVQFVVDNDYKSDWFGPGMNDTLTSLMISSLLTCLLGLV